MKRHLVVWRPAAQTDLLALYDWIAERAGAGAAFEYANKIEAFATRLSSFPERGAPRDDLMLGLRTLLYRRRTLIAYRLAGGEVEILRLVHAGQEWDILGDEART